MIKNDKLQEKHNDILDKVSYAIRKEFDSNPVYNKKYLRAKKIIPWKNKQQIYVTIRRLSIHLLVGDID